MTVHVLLVDDSRAMRDYVTSILETAGDYEVHEVDNGFDALRELPREAWGLIITDINMPDVSGIEFAHYVRSSDKHVETPIIVISTDASAVDRERALSAGASAFLAKPFTGRDLLDTIERAGAGGGT